MRKLPVLSDRGEEGGGEQRVILTQRSAPLLKWYFGGREEGCKRGTASGFIIFTFHKGKKLAGESNPF